MPVFHAIYLCTLIPSSLFQAQNLGFQIMIDIFVFVSIIKNAKYEILNAVNYSYVTSNGVKSGRWFDNFLNNASGVDLNSPGNVCHGTLKLLTFKLITWGGNYMKSGKNLADLTNENKAHILRYLIHHEGISRIELSAATGLRPASITKIIQQLI